MLGKSRYYDQRFIPHSMPSTTFCTNIPTAVKFTAKIWREKQTCVWVTMLVIKH
jgi:hypothetical protein